MVVCPTHLEFIQLVTTQACHFEAEGREIHYDYLLQSKVRVDFSSLRFSK
jgi:hypothetical protein